MTWLYKEALLKQLQPEEAIAEKYPRRFLRSILRRFEQFDILRNGFAMWEKWRRSYSFRGEFLPPTKKHHSWYCSLLAYHFPLSKRVWIPNFSFVESSIFSNGFLPHTIQVHTLNALGTLHGCVGHVESQQDMTLHGGKGTSSPQTSHVWWIKGFGGMVGFNCLGIHVYQRPAAKLRPPGPCITDYPLNLSPWHSSYLPIRIFGWRHHYGCHCCNGGHHGGLWSHCQAWRRCVCIRGNVRNRQVLWWPSRALFRLRSSSFESDTAKALMHSHRGSGVFSWYQISRPWEKSWPITNSLAGPFGVWSPRWPKLSKISLSVDNTMSACFGVETDNVLKRAMVKTGYLHFTLIMIIKVALKAYDKLASRQSAMRP